MLREAVTGISPPEAEKHQLFIDVQPTMGTALRARARIQINLAVSQVRDIKQVASFPDIVFPIMWFEDVSQSFALYHFLALSFLFPFLTSFALCQYLLRESDTIKIFLEI